MTPAPISQVPGQTTNTDANAMVLSYYANVMSRPNFAAYRTHRKELTPTETITMRLSDAANWIVTVDRLLATESTEDSRSGDLERYKANDQEKCRCTSKGRALIGTHEGLGNQFYSSVPDFTPTDFISCNDMLGWYRFMISGVLSVPRLPHVAPTLTRISSADGGRSQDSFDLPCDLVASWGASWRLTYPGAYLLRKAICSRGIPLTRQIANRHSSRSTWPHHERLSSEFRWTGGNSLTGA